MSLQVWLPLNGNLKNQGLKNVTSAVSGTTAFTNGKIGQGLSCNGSSFWTITGVELGTEASICCWTKTAVNGKMSWVLVASSSDRLNLYENSIYTLNTGDGNSNPFTNSSGSNISCLHDGKWHHFAVTFGNSVAKLYIDGEYKGKANTFKSPATTSAKIIKLGGGYAGGHTYDWNGIINDFRVYNNCLSDEQVKDISKGLILHYPLNNRGFGTYNLIKQANSLNLDRPFTNSDHSTRGAYVTCPANTNTIVLAQTGAFNAYRWFSNGSTNLLSVEITDILTPGQPWTFSIDIKSEAEGTFILWMNVRSDNSDVASPNSKTNTAGYVDLKTDWNRYWVSITPREEDSARNKLLIGVSGTATKAGTIYFRNLKFEKGDKATTWGPSTTENLGVLLDIGGITEYDTSGYQYNGTKNNITYESDTPKYEVSSVFNGTNSYIKANDSTWMPQGIEELTINLWAKSTSWAGKRLFSCTESGGFNTEAGNTGYLRFSIHVYTNSGKTSTAYAYDSQEIKVSDLSTTDWVMLTFVYDGTGTKTYINGVLHHTYSNVSYGIHFNTNARLFLGCEASTASPSSPYFSGKESDFRIYATALSAEDVAELYSQNHLELED